MRLNAAEIAAKSSDLARRGKGLGTGDGIAHVIGIRGQHRIYDVVGRSRAHP